MKDQKLKVRDLHSSHTLGDTGEKLMFVYYVSIKGETKKRLIFECRCNTRLKSKDEESTHLTYTR